MRVQLEEDTIRVRIDEDELTELLQDVALLGSTAFGKAFTMVNFCYFLVKKIFFGKCRLTMNKPNINCVACCEIKVNLQFSLSKI